VSKNRRIAPAGFAPPAAPATSSEVAAAASVAVAATSATEPRTTELASLNAEVDT
jgi:hypothetical protein